MANDSKQASDTANAKAQAAAMAIAEFRNQSFDLARAMENFLSNTAPDKAFTNAWINTQILRLIHAAMQARDAAFEARNFY